MYKLMFIPLMFLTSCFSSTEKKIESAVGHILKNYPLSQADDLYKSFFQDVYGPGHLINDTASALKYLRYELEQMDSLPSQKEAAESTGYKSQFVRVDLYYVKTKMIPQPVFEKAFLESARGFQLPEIDDWKKEWALIASVIRKTQPGIPGLEESLRNLSQMLDKGEYVVHHSPAFTAAYLPHYRLIRNDVFRSQIMPYLIKEAE